MYISAKVSNGADRDCDVPKKIASEGILSLWMKAYELCNAYQSLAAYRFLCHFSRHLPSTVGDDS